MIRETRDLQNPIQFIQKVAGTIGRATRFCLVPIQFGIFGWREHIMSSILMKCNIPDTQPLHCCDGEATTGDALIRTYSNRFINE